MTSQTMPQPDHAASGQLLVGNILKTAALRFGDREAFFCSETGRRFSFRQVNERCNRLANALTALGLRKGDVVAVLCRNRVEIVETMFALAKTGLVGLPLNYRLASQEALALMQEVNAVALVCEATFLEVAMQARSELSESLHCAIVGAQQQGMLDYDALIAEASPDEPTCAVHESDLFYFNLTSGTSGLPKCYALTHYNNATAWTMFHAMALDTRDVLLTAFPIFGRVGFMWALAGLLYGLRNTIMNFEAGRIAQLIEQERITITNLVPTMGAMMLSHEAFARHDLSSLRAIVFAGSSLPAAIREGITGAICPDLYEYYGMQETGTLVVSTPEDRLLRPDSVGQPILHADVQIVDGNGHALPPGQLGEIVGRAPSCAIAYHQNPAKTAETFRNGWVYTGDLGMQDTEGYLYIRGRKKEVIVTGGQNVFAAEVEQAILSHADVQDCAVIGLPDELWGERVSAVVVLRESSAPSAESIVLHCRKQLAGFKTPKQIIFRSDALPRTPTGKVRKFVLVEQYASQSETSKTLAERA